MFLARWARRVGYGGVGILLMMAGGAAWTLAGRDHRAVEVDRPDPSPPPPAVAPDTLRLVTYNIAHGRGPAMGAPNAQEGDVEARRRRLIGIGHGLKDLSADVIFLQEVDFNTWWSHGMDQAAIIAEAADFPYLVRQRNIDTGIPGIRRWDFGNALLSRLPIADAERIRLPPFSDLEVLVAGNHDALAATIDLGGGETLVVLGAHLEVRDEETRVQAAEALLRYQRGNAHPMILMGDLNSTPPGFPDSQTTALGQNAVELLEGFGGFQRRPARGRATYRDFTFPTEAPRRIIDWILPDRNFRILEYRVVPTLRESDHLAVLATVRRR